MKFSIRQILASAVGAVIAAVIASTFGVKGTIIGVAIGSAAATFGTALVAQSIERGQEAVKQVVVRAPDSSTLLRKLGSTVATGEAESSEDAASPSTASGERDRSTWRSPPRGGDRQPASPAPATERIEATTLPMQPAGPTRRRAAGRPRSFSWQTIAGTAAIVFVIALLFITGIELISGQPLSAIFGDHGTGTSVQHIFTPSPSPSPSTDDDTGADDDLDHVDDHDRATTSTSTHEPTSTTTTTRPPAGTSTTTTTTSPSTTTTTTRVGGTTTTSSAG